MQKLTAGKGCHGATIILDSLERKEFGLPVVSAPRFYSMSHRMLITLSSPRSETCRRSHQIRYPLSAQFGWRNSYSLINHRIVDCIASPDHWPVLYHYRMWLNFHEDSVAKGEAKRWGVLSTLIKYQLPFWRPHQVVHNQTMSQMFSWFSLI